MIIFGFLRDFLRLIRGVNRSANQYGFVDLKPRCEHFYTRNMYSNAKHLFSRPVFSAPGVEIDVYNLKYGMDCKLSELRNKGDIARDVINIGSYNYLGFAENNALSSQSVRNQIRQSGLATCLPVGQLDCFRKQFEMEEMMAKFMKKEACIAFGMGFATNSTNLSCLVSKGSLILSDQYNHSSLVLGARLSGATVRVFPHNDMIELERMLRDLIVCGQPRTKRPWKKILIITEGVYSMEGTICNLPELIRLKKQYKAYLYVDEAHSIGAVGEHGRGVADYFGCDTSDIDILMGTFTKSFASSGGYITANKDIINHIRATSHSVAYSSSMSPVICEQIISCLKVMTGLENPGDGERRFKSLADNTTYFRKRLKDLGYIIYGHDASPVVPLLVYLPGKVRFISEKMLERGIAIVVVGFPATSLVASRIRFCLSAGHTTEQLEKIIDTLGEFEKYVGLRYNANKIRITGIKYD